MFVMLLLLMLLLMGWWWCIFVSEPRKRQRRPSCCLSASSSQPEQSIWQPRADMLFWASLLGSMRLESAGHPGGRTTGPLADWCGR
ncbi:uncharacterized protein BJ171DRAFT_515253 [Polychytrium aggregatum]|uniref:uncharacterized protein n=1 Tax=Polychytrium aggregatum TaxID=110093 RepID=UPI0022FEEA7C|nr:uncharacterized protein BJ171DRAFT_515253 [Polychytrium aggregatum]KAI9202239.1 hypothetical protein BJ171DRAFT_515253 [Polychytrium aggregatum]